MSAQRPNPTAGRLILAARLRQLRLAAGRTPDEAAREVVGSTSKISKIETGERAATARDIRDLGRLYGIPDNVEKELQQLAVEARRKGWWANYRSIDEQAQQYLGLETAASSAQLLENLRWPGLLQTPEVTKAFLSGLRPGGELTGQFIEDQIMVRQKRQERLLGGDLEYHVILDEAMFRRPLGPGIVHRQVQRIVELSSLPGLRIQIVPFTAGVYPGLDGTFQLLRFPARTLDPIVFVEGLLGNYVVDRDSDVEHYETVFRSVAENNALSPDESIAWLKKIRSSE